MKVLVEDDIVKFPYPLLTNFSKCVIKGSKSNGNIVSYMFKETKNNTVVFVDTMPDNYNSVRAYKEAIYAGRKLSNVYVVPIPCIEYYFSKAFIHRESEERSAVLSFGKFRDIKFNTFHKKLATSRTFEKFCKSVVEKEMDCFSNGVFIEDACKCTFAIDDCTALSLYEKYLMFIQNLPLGTILESGDISIDDIHKAQNVGVSLYYECARKFKKYGYISDIFII